jgi:hypothetical protein
MVDLFRNSAAAGGPADEALNLDPLPAVIWMQLGVVNEEAAEWARAKGVTVVMNCCPKIEFSRLFDRLRAVSGRGACERLTSRLVVVFCVPFMRYIVAVL